jgi:hypothetical protein
MNDKNCVICGVPFIKPYGYSKNQWESRKYCSSKCVGAIVSEIRKGKRPWNYKGVSSFNKLERERFRSTVQKQVFERDNYCCVLCGKKGRLQVDHIERWADKPELRFILKNCRTLCESCHYQITFGKNMPNNITTWGHNLKSGGTQ